MGYDGTSLAQLYLGSFSHSSLQILSTSVSLDAERRCTAIFRSLQRCSIGFKSGLWLGHSRTFKDLSRSHSCVVLAVYLGCFSSEADPLKLCQVGWGALLHSCFLVSPEILDRVQVWTLAGPLKDIKRLVPKPLLCCLGSVLRVVVLLESNPSPQSEVLSTLE